MKTVHHCAPSEFCVYQKETGGEYGVPLEIVCMANPCPFPQRQCLVKKLSGE